MRRKRGRGLVCGIFLGVLASWVSASWCEARTESGVSVTRKERPSSLVKHSSGESSGVTRPNVVWIVLDACRAQNLSCYGYERSTSPNIDALAREGVLFEEMHSQAFWTLPSVSGYMSGQLFPRLALFGNPAIREHVVIPRMNARLLPETLEENGYHTCLVSAHAGYIRDGCPLWNAFAEKTLLVPEVKKDTSTGEAYVSLDRVCSVVLPWIEKRHDSPFFLYIHAMDTHFPHNLTGDEFRQWLPREYAGTAVKNGQPVVSPGQFCEEGFFEETDKEYLRGLYDGSIRYADKYVGRIIDKLKEAGLFESTFVIVTADHGESLGECGNYWGHGDNLDTEELTRVPCIVSGPSLPRGVKVAHMTQLIDIYPTLVEALGLNTKAELHGKSLFPLLTTSSSAEPPHQLAVSVGKFNGHGQPRLYAQDREFKYSLDLNSGEEHLWRRPDRAVDRSDMLRDLPETATRMKAYAERSLVPLYQESVRSPGGVFLTCHITKDALSPDNAYVSPSGDVGGEVHRDNKWCFSSKGNTLWSSGAYEDSPPTTLTFVVPNGTYHVVLELLQDADHNGTGIPASALMVTLPGERVFRKVTTGPSATGAQSGYILFPVGVCNVDKGRFVLTLDDVNDGFCFVRKVFLVSESIDIESGLAQIRGLQQGGIAPDAADLESQQEALKALGYLN